MLIGILVGLAASWPAARRIAALEPASVLRLGGLPPDPPPRTWRLLGWGAFSIAVGAIAIVLEVRWRSVAWGNFGLAFWHFSIFLLAIPFVQGCVRLWQRWPKIAGTAGRTAAAAIARTPLRTGLAVAAIVLTLSLSMMIATLVHSGSESVVEYFGSMLGGDLTVSAVTTDGGWLETPVTEELTAVLEKVPGVRSVERCGSSWGSLERAHRIGRELQRAAQRATGQLQVAQVGIGLRHAAVAATRRGTGVSISASLATRMDLHVGMPIELDTPSGILRRPIVGVFRDYMSERGSVIMSRRLYQEFWPDRTVNRFFVARAGRIGGGARGDRRRRSRPVRAPGALGQEALATSATSSSMPSPSPTRSSC
jgi:putative ABC transport system permease protein